MRTLLARRGVQWLLLALTILITRLPFHSRYLFEWDSVLYTWGMAKFDVAWHRPHPPGYLFYVLMGRLFNTIIPDPNQALILLNITLSIATVLLTYRLAELMFDRDTALIASAVMVFGPVFWFYGDVAANYVAEAFAAASVALACWLACTRKGNYLYLSALVLGLAGGFRQNLVVFLSWYIPTIQASGGFAAYRAAVGGFSANGSDKLHIWYGTLASYYASSTLNLLVWAAQLLAPLGIFALGYGGYRLLKQRGIGPVIRSERAQFGAIWFLPAFGVYALLFLDKPGYLLTFYPALCIAAARLLRGIVRRRLALIVAANAALCAIWFVAPTSLVPHFRFPDADLRRPPRSDYTWDISRREIEYVDVRVETLQQIITDETDQRDLTPDNTVIVYHIFRPHWPQVSYYLPDYLNIWLLDVEGSGLLSFGAEAYYSQHGEVWSASGLPVWAPGERPNFLDITLPAGTRYVVWLAQPKTVVYLEVSGWDNTIELI